MRIQLQTAAIVGLFASLSFSQSNEIPGTEVSLGILGGMNGLAHKGTFPNGEAAFAMSTTSCNLGTVNVPWLAAMQSNHPVIGFLIARESNGRLEQISDRTAVKHGFFALSNSQCIPCQNPSNGSFLGVGCSDTYSISVNANNANLGPADEIDPWLHNWQPVCSFFDMGQPPVNAPFNCDGVKSQITPVDNLGARVRVMDADLNVAGARYFYQAQYVVRGEPEVARFNNVASRRFVPSWNGSNWVSQVPGTSTNPQVPGTVLSQWTGASVTSTLNGQDDGRVFVGVNVIPLGGGNFRYEYALHNRDNNRGVGEIRIPVCPGATVSNAGFSDIDNNGSNDWTFSRTATDVVYDTSNNPLKWNTIYNFWFDCNAAPVAGFNMSLGAFNPGPGADTMLCSTTAPMNMALGTDLGFSTVGSNGLAPEFETCGNLDSGSQGGFLVRFAQPNTAGFLFAGVSNNPTSLLDGFLVPIPVLVTVPVMSNNQGEVGIVLPGGNGPLQLFIQFVMADPAKPAGYAFTNAVQVPFGP